eukprot:TRINITY_DN25567_c0_g1_i2.p1 TRINITY_DN25567_c0_g1~~TRINITY_DN25567_c0_g1_i2.p1  ORF type:complete len:472 (-),score=64.61 TRINITY_DN25567_c0_g1_i2:232-1647(-)
MRISASQRLWLRLNKTRPSAVPVTAHVSKCALVPGANVSSWIQTCRTYAASTKIEGKRSRSADRSLTIRLQKSRSLPVLLDLLQEQLTTFNLIHCSTAHVVLAKHLAHHRLGDSHEQGSLVVAKLEAKTVLLLHDAEPRALSNILWATAKRATACEGHSIWAPGNDLIATSKAQAAKKVHHFNEEDISTCMWSLATLRCDDETELIEVLALHAKSRLGDFQPQNLSNTIWAFATLRSNPDASFLCTLESASMQKSLGFRPQHLAITLWAFAKLMHQPSPTLLQRFSTEAGRCLQDFSPQNVANMLLAWTQLSYRPNKQLLRMIEEHCYRKLNGFSPHHLTCSMSSFARLSHQPGDAFLVSHCQMTLRTLESFTAQDLANTLWAYASLSYNPGHDILRDFAADLCHKSENLSPHELTNSWWALVKLRIISNSIAKRLAGHAKENLHDFKPQDLVVAMWCCVMLVGERCPMLW